MSYVLKKQKFYIEVDANNNPKMTSSLRSATKYKTLVQAENFLNNNIKSEERSRYQVVELTREQTSTKRASAEQNIDVISELKAAESKVLDSLIKEKTRLQQTIEYYDNVVCDILHFMREESTRLNACQAAKTFYKQQEVTRQRALAKKELNRILAVERFMSNAIEVAENFDYDEYKPREVLDMSIFIGL